MTFYRRLYDEHGVTPSQIRGMADLEKLPRVSKKMLQRTAIAERIAKGIDPSRLLVRQTTGTTGEPLSVFTTLAESRLLDLYYFQAFRSLGVRRSDLAAGIRLPRPGEPNAEYTPLRKLANRLRIYPRTDLFSVRPAELLEAFKQLRPEVIGGVPGRLSLFASKWPEADREFVRRASWPQLVVTGGEKLSTSIRAHLSEAFGAPVFDMYSSVEFHLIAFECLSTGAYHVSDETVALEILKEGRPAVSGETGQPVMTALHLFASPVIRYKVSDLVTVGQPTCECGASLSTLTSIDGRSMNFFEFSDGAIFQDVKINEAIAFAAPWARQTQLSLPSPDVMIVKIAPLGATSAEDQERLRLYIADFVGNRARVEVVIDPELGPVDGEKFRSMIRPDDAKPTTP